MDRWKANNCRRNRVNLAIIAKGAIPDKKLNYYCYYYTLRNHHATLHQSFASVSTFLFSDHFSILPALKTDFPSPGCSLCIKLQSQFENKLLFQKMRLSLKILDLIKHFYFLILTDPTFILFQFTRRDVVQS